MSVDAGPLEGILYPNERVLWRGQPQGRLLSAADAYLIPFSLLWLAFMSFAEVNAIASGVIFFAIGGTAFLAFGLYLALGRFIFKARKRRVTIYAVTNQRVIEKSGPTTRSVSLAHLPPLQVISGRAGGRIVFGSSDGLAGVYANTGLDRLAGAYAGLPLAFYDIPDPAGVAKTIWEAAEAVSQAPLKAGGVG